MRTYKEPKRIDKARGRDPCLVNHDENISKLSALSGQVEEEEDLDNSSDKDDEIVDESGDAGVQENHLGNDIDNENVDEAKEDEDIDDKKVEEQNDVEDKKEIQLVDEDQTLSSGAKKKTPPKKSKKVIKNNMNHSSCNVEKNTKINSVGTKPKKINNTKVKEIKKKKTVSKAKDSKESPHGEVLNNCIVDLGDKRKVSPKLKGKQNPAKRKKKLDVSDMEVDELHVDTSEKSTSLNTSESSSVSPRSSKRTPIKNRKYQSDDELEDTESSGKKKRSRSKSPRCSTPKRRKLNFEESEFMNIDDEFLIPNELESISNEAGPSKATKVAKPVKNKSLAKSDLILKPKARKKKKLTLDESKESNELNDDIDKSDSIEKSKEDNVVNENGEVKNEPGVSGSSVKEKKKKTVKKKIKKEEKLGNESLNTSNETVNEDSKTKKDDIKNEIDDSKMKDGKQDDTDQNNEKGEKTEEGEKVEKKEKRKMKPLETIVCTYCKKVSVGKAANTRHLKKCYVYQAKLEMEKQANENGGIDQSESKLCESQSGNKESDSTRIYSEVNNESNTQNEKSTEDLNESTDKNEDNQNEDKENLDDSLTKANDSLSSENKSDLNLSGRRKSKQDVIYNCQHCDYTANKRAKLAKHLHCHSIYMCLRCSFFCESNDDLNDHMHREHKDRMDHKLCRKCSRYVHCADVTLEQHMETCQGPVPFKCPHCEKEFKYESSLKSHVVKHDPDGPKKFECPQCAYKSNYKANLKKHLINIHSSKVKQFKCTYENCEKMFHSEDNLRRHLKYHKIHKPYKCDECGKEFRTSGALNGHCTIHSTETPFKCSVVDCDRAFRSQRHLYNHLQDYHNQGEKKFICQHPGCDFAFFKRSHLDRHLVTHSGERKFGCSYCGKEFRHADNLRVHLRQHTNEKPVTCNMCEFRCRQKSSLRYHLQKVHNIVFKKREKRKIDPTNNVEVLKTTPEASLQLIEAIVNAVAKSEDLLTDKDSSVTKTEKLDTADSDSATRPSSPSKEKAVDLYEFKSDDDFGDDDMMVPLPLPMKRTINHLTPSKSIDKVDKGEEKSEKFDKNKFVKKSDIEEDDKIEHVEDEEEEEEEKEAKSENEDEDEATDTEHPDLTEEVEKPSTPKGGRRGKKQKINYAEPETDISFETVETKEETKEEPKDKKDTGKKKRGPRKSKQKEEKPEDDVKDDDENKEIKPKGKRGRKKVEKAVVEKVPKKRGRKPKTAVVEEKNVKSKKVPLKKKRGRVGRPRKVKAQTSESENEKEEKEEESENEEENESDKDETKKFQRDEDDDTVDAPIISPPNADDDDDTREYTGDENLKENENLVQDDEKDQSDDDFVPEKKEQKENHDGASVVEKQSEHESEKMSSGIDTDFEDDLKPPPAPRPPPVVDSDEGDIESGPEEMDTPGRDFESTPPKSNLTEHIHSVPAHTPRDFESSPPKSVQTSDYGPTPSTHSQTGFENRREGDSVEGMSGSYNATPSREVSIEEKHDEREASLPYQHDNLPNTQTSPLMESVQGNSGPQSNINPDYGSQSESTMPEVDKEYLGQYLQQFDSASRSEDDRIERLNSQNEQSSEPIEIPHSPTKELPPLNLSANAPPLNLSTNSNDRENSQESDLSSKRLEILSIDRQQDDHYSGSRSENVSRSSDRLPDNVYESINSMNSFIPPTTREIPTSESPFPSVSTPSTFMRFSESESLLQRQRMTTPFLSQGDPNALQNLHRMADNALAQHNNASLLRRPTTVPPRDDMFSSSTATMANIARNPFHNSWASQEVRPAHWSQSPYIGRSIDRPTATASSSLFGKDNYLAGREFMFEPSRRAVADRNVFPGLPQTQRPELPHDTFSVERFDIGSYFGGHTYPGASSLTDYNRAAAAHTSQKTFDERYRQSSTGITDFRALPQTTASSVFSSNVLNSSFHFDKYMYSRDPMYAQHIPDATNSPFLPGVPGQHSVFDRDYTRGYFQNSPYSLDKQYAAAAAASAKLTHPSGASVVQDRDLVPRPGTAAATGDNQVPDTYRHQMFYNMMNHRFYE